MEGFDEPASGPRQQLPESAVEGGVTSSPVICYC
jgi:hypothetical protein